MGLAGMGDFIAKLAKQMVTIVYKITRRVISLDSFFFF